MATSPIQEEVNKLLGELRRSYGFKFYQIAERIGVTRRAIYSWSSGEKIPTIEHLRALRGLVTDARKKGSRAREQPSGEPVYARAAEAYALGELKPWPRSTTIR